MVQYSIVHYIMVLYGKVQYSIHSIVVVLKNSSQFFIFKLPGTLSKYENQSTVLYVTVPCYNVLYQSCQGTKGAKGVRG